MDYGIHALVLTPRSLGGPFAGVGQVDDLVLGGPAVRGRGLPGLCGAHATETALRAQG